MLSSGVPAGGFVMPRAALVLLRVAKRLAHPHSYSYIQSAINALEDDIRRRGL